MMLRWICALVFGHLPEHGDFVGGHWAWRCLRCGRTTS